MLIERISDCTHADALTHFPPKEPRLVDFRNCQDCPFLVKQAGIAGKETGGHMDGQAADRTILFAGDLDDPWAGWILSSISCLAGVRTVDVKGPITARLFADDDCLRTVIIHRARLS